MITCEIKNEIIEEASMGTSSTKKGCHAKHDILFHIVLVVGLEPTRGCPQQILSLPRLPFRHTSLLEVFNRVI